MIAVDAIPIYSLYGDQFDILISFKEFLKFITGLQGNNKGILNYKFNFCDTGKWVVEFLVVIFTLNF